MDIKAIEKLVQLAKKYKLAELSVEEGRAKVHVKTWRGAAIQGAQTMALAPATTAVTTKSIIPPVEAQVAATAPVAQDEGRYHKVLSPFVGTFYRAPAPEAEPYVKEGQTVRKGDVLCIVEAMKLMNEIESEVAGKIVSVLAENGQPVEYGEPLFLIEPL